MMFRLTRYCVVLVLLLVSPSSVGARADSLSGVWTMTKYEGPASHGDATTGQLICTDGHFSLIYTMDESGQRWGRAHAGTYTLSGDTLTFHVGWSMEYVSGKPSVAAKASDRDTKFTLSDDTLAITFSNKAVQTFMRAK
jgi:hypothetical protein